MIHLVTSSLAGEDLQDWLGIGGDFRQLAHPCRCTTEERYLEIHLPPARKTGRKKT